jgi:hypothetical protein
MKTKTGSLNRRGVNAGEHFLASTGPASNVPPKATYGERAAVMGAEARRVELRHIGTRYARLAANVADATELLVAAVNDAREMGLELQMACNHEKMDKLFWRDRCASQLPFELEAAKGFIAIARKLPKPANDYAAAAPFVAAVLLAEKILKLPARAAAQKASAASPAQKFFAKVTMLRQPFKKIARPVEGWTAEERRQFMAETEWVVAEREKARGLAAADLHGL